MILSRHPLTPSTLPATLDTKRIRNSTPAQLRDYYVELTKHISDESVTAQLLQAVERGAIAPITFAPWLGVSKSSGVIREALRQNKSVLVRKLAIKQLRRRLSSLKWKETWDGMGSTVGVLDIFSDLSVLEIREACKAIGRCAKGKELNEKRECYTKFFKGLHPSTFADAEFKTSDRRPLAKYYGLLMPACSESLVDEAVADSRKQLLHHGKVRYLMRYHPEAMRRKNLQCLAGDHIQSMSEEDLKTLVQQYPPADTKEPGFSASMEFAFTVLRTLAESGSSQVDDHFFVNDLVRPLLKRAIKKRANWAKILEIVNLTMQYLEAHPTVGKEITTTVGDISHLVAQCWSREPQLFESQLRRLFSHPVFGTAILDEPRNWEGFLEHILPARRYALLQLAFQESTGLDLNVDADLKKVKGPLTYDLIISLGTKQALSLFTRLRRTRGDEGLVEAGNSNSILRLATTHEGFNGDPDLYHIVLQSRNGNQEEAENLAKSYVEARKGKAFVTSQPEERGFYAKSALFTAIGSGSLILYLETVDWAKRFLRDPLAIRQIFPRSYPKEASRLLSGIPDPLESLPSTTVLRQRVEKGNSILLSMFEIACASLREPSFSSRDWEGTLGLFSSVVQDRIDLSPKIKKLHNASNADLYQGLWEATIPMLLSIEDKVNQEGLDKLGASGLRGVLGCVRQSAIELELKDMSTLTFFDNLAQARDTLWRKLRSELYPATAALPPPFPRGLPIQHLTAPWNLNSRDLESCAPYLASRVEAVLFLDPVFALRSAPADEVSQKAIGMFVDSYRYALHLYIPKSIRRPETEIRAGKAWSFAIGSLSQPRMDGEEAVRFWRSQGPKHLKEWPPQEFALDKRATWPLIPETGNPLEPWEWNPFTSGRPDSHARDLGDPTYIDLSLAVDDQTSHHPTVHDKLESVFPKVPAGDAATNTIWDSTRNIGEGGVLSALLYLHAKYVSGDPLLIGPYPSEYEPRYPFLYLDDDSMSSDVLNPLIAVRDIRGHLNATPPAIIARLAQDIMKTLDEADPDASTYIVLHEVAMLLIVRLGESDRPDAGTELAIRTILHKPKSSSWHRQLLKPGVLRRLPAFEARACIEAFASRIFDILQAEDGAAQGSRDGKSDVVSELRWSRTKEESAGKPSVKVTTQKFLAQLFQGAEFVGKDDALSFLSSLYQKSSHVDVHLNIVKELLSMLSFGSPVRSDDVLAALELLVPSAGSLNERRPLTEADWAHSEETLSLPELQEGILHTSSPILAAFMYHFRNAPSDPKQSPSFVDRIIVPTLLCAKQQTERWIGLFLRKYGLDYVVQGELQIPVVPRDPSVSQLLLSADNARVGHIPCTVLEEYVSYITFNIAPSVPIRELNKKLREDPALSSQNDVQTWLRIYGSGLDAVRQLKSFDLIPRLGVDVSSARNDGITPRVVQEQFLKLFTAVLWNDTPTYTILNKFLTQRFLEGVYLIQPWWKPHGKPIVEAMIAYVDNIRTRDWERDVTRKPSVLPDTFPWRLLLLDYPWPGRTEKDEDCDRKCKVFVKQLGSIIDGISGSRYHGKLSQIKSYLALDPVSSTADRSTVKKIGGKWTVFYDKRDPLYDILMHNRILTAVQLGDITKTRLSWVTAPELLRVEVASYLVEIAGDFKDINEALKKRVKLLLGVWKNCENEDVRRVGWVLEEKYFPPSG